MWSALCISLAKLLALYEVKLMTCLCSSLYSSSEIPQFRLPYDVVSFEVELMKDLGVKVGLSCDNVVTLM